MELRETRLHMDVLTPFSGLASISNPSPIPTKRISQRLDLVTCLPACRHEYGENKSVFRATLPLPWSIVSLWCIQEARQTFDRRNLAILDASILSLEPKGCASNHEKIEELKGDGGPGNKVRWFLLAAKNVKRRSYHMPGMYLGASCERKIVLPVMPPAAPQVIIAAVTTPFLLG